VIQKFDGTDLKKVRWSLAVLVVCIGIAAAIIVGVRLADKAVRAEERQANATRNEIRDKLARARDEEQDIRTKIGRYQEINARGYVTPELRLDWIDHIAHIRASRKLIDVQYELLPQKPVDSALLPEGAKGGGYEFMSSSMKLQMQLLHEDDLLGFLADLRTGVRALLVVRRCDVERLAPQAGSDRATRAQLKADCEIDWITLREAK
jgi:hypothetical protein